ncbi:RHS repeat-associated core domain-containing protein, partial [Micromonospora sp. LOL_014]|uniref:RHS repeat-associated core domain-containing protein n=1 Tax=Micromonospora sp. LOL_014 TaxID=3345415 RepID=UPI003A8A7A20
QSLDTQDHFTGCRHDRLTPPSYTYDNSGNTLTRPTATAGTQTLTWDHEGRLESMTDTSGVTGYLYDADGNRLIRRDPTGTTLYLPGQEIRHDTGTNQTSCTRYYSHAGKTIASRSAAGLTWLVEDHQQTAQVAVDATTGTATTRRQTPYGTVRGSASGWPNDKGFVGGTVENNGLVFIGVRAYDLTIGRFISIDPLQDHDDPLQWNGYAYANNSPITFSDPDGLKPLITDSVQGDEDHYRKYGEKVVYKKGKWVSNKASSGPRRDGKPDIFKCDKQTTCTIRGQDKDTKNVIYECNSPGSCIIENRGRGSGAIYNCNVAEACHIDSDCRNEDQICYVGGSAVDGELACRVKGSCVFFRWVPIYPENMPSGERVDWGRIRSDMATNASIFGATGAGIGIAIGGSIGGWPGAVSGAGLGGGVGMYVGVTWTAWHELYEVWNNRDDYGSGAVWVTSEKREFARI